MARHDWSDALVAAVEVRPDLGPGHALTVLAWAGGVPPAGGEAWASAGDLPGLGAVFRFTGWGGVERFAACAAQHRDWSSNANGVRFAANRDRGDAPFEAVLVNDCLDEATMSHAAFDALCGRAFEALRAAFAVKAADAHDAPWWQGFLEHAAVVAARRGAA